MEQTLQLPEPAFILLKSPPGIEPPKEVKIDVYAARRMLLDEAAKKPSEHQRWEYVKHWLAKTLELEPDQIAENMALRFHNVVMEQCGVLNAELSKSIFPIASLDESTGASQEALPNGPVNSKKLG